jgi:hypothetical protein
LRKKLIKKDEKIFTHSKERVVRKGKIKVPPPSHV